MPKSSTLPTQRTLAALRKSGCLCAVVERWNVHAKIRQDVFGFIDILAVHPAGGIIGVQCTSATNHTGHRRKILDEPRALEWLKGGGRIHLWSWEKKLKLTENMKTVVRWRSRTEEITERNFE